MERGEWITSTPVWVYFPAEKEDRGRKLEISSSGRPGQTQRKSEMENNRETDPQLMVSEIFFQTPQVEKATWDPCILMVGRSTPGSTPKEITSRTATDLTPP